MQLYGVVVRTIEGKSELRHRECVGVDAIENDSPVLRRFSRSAFATEREYTERKERAKPAPIAAGSFPPRGKGRRLSASGAYAVKR